MSDANNINRLCRLCAKKCKGINVFSEEGARYKLESKIRRYLCIKIIKEDQLPKAICANCKMKLDNHHKFASMASNIQDKLSSYLNSECDDGSSTNDHDGDDDIEDDEENGYDEDADVDSDKEDESNNVEFSGSLLHSILTSGKEQIDSDQNSAEAEVTEVEVKIDPMLFLSGHDDNSVDPENSKDMITSDPTANSTKTDSSEDEAVHTEINMKDHKPYKCSICPRGFNSEISLQNHLWSHFSRKILSNSDFNSRLRSQSRGSVYSLNGVMHAVSDLPTNHPYVCPICGRQISTKGNLKVHLETHRPKGKYDCDICGRIFKTQSNLYRHKEYHAGVQFTCEVCSRVYPTKSTLRAHSITHSDLRPHQCPLCDKTFKRNQDLKFHINQHTGARPYKCPFCPKAFASSGNCFSHRKRMHPGEVQLEKYKGLSGILVQ